MPRLVARVTVSHDETVLGRHPGLGLRVGTQINVTLSQAATVHVRIAVDSCFDTKLSAVRAAPTARVWSAPPVGS